MFKVVAEFLGQILEIEVPGKVFRCVGSVESNCGVEVTFQLTMSSRIIQGKRGPDIGSPTTGAALGPVGDFPAEDLVAERVGIGDVINLQRKSCLSDFGILRQRCAVARPRVIGNF